MTLSVLLIQNEEVSPAMLSLIASKIPDANIQSVSYENLSGLGSLSHYALVISQDKFIEKALLNRANQIRNKNTKKSNAIFIHGKDLSELSRWLENFVQLKRCLLQYPLVLDDWKIVEVLHENETLIIYRATSTNIDFSKGVDNQSSKQAAIKRFKFKPLHLTDSVVKKYLKSIKVASSHAGLVQFYDGGVNSQAFYLVMQYLPRGSLRQSLDACGTLLPQTHALEWFQEIVQALDAVHHMGLIHHDLKIDNIMLRDDGSLALMDYGISKRILLGAGLMLESELHCSPYYVSPEQVSGDACTQASDIYSLGVIFYELLTGQKPYTASQANELVMQHVLAPVPELTNELEQYQPILDKLMAKDPSDRYDKIIDIIKEIKAIEESSVAA